MPKIKRKSGIPTQTIIVRVGRKKRKKKKKKKRFRLAKNIRETFFGRSRVLPI